MFGSLFEVTYADHQLQVASWPLLAAVVAAALAWVGGVAALLGGLGAGRPRWLLGVGLALATPLVVALAWMIPPLLAWQASAGSPCEGCGPAVLSLISPALIATAAVAFATAIGCGLSAFALGAWPGRLRPTLLGGAALVVALVPFVASTAFFTWLGALGQAPLLDATAPARVHVGAAAQLDVLASMPDGFALAPVDPVDTSQAGRPLVTLVASAYGVTARRELADLLVVGAEIGSPHFPIRQGATWTFEGYLDQGVDARVLFMGGQRRVESRGEATVKVGAPEVVDGLRRFPLRMTAEDGTTVFEVPIYAFDGETFAILDDGERPLLTLADPSGRPYGPGPTSCRFAPLPEVICTCNARPGGRERAPPGPIRCVQGSHDTGQEVVRGLMLVLTIGMVDIGSSRNDRGIRLVDFEPGPVEAPGVGPVWDPGPGFDEDVLALRKRLDRARWDDERLRILKRDFPTRLLHIEEAALLTRAFAFDQQEALGVLVPQLADPADIDLLIEHELSFERQKAAARAVLGR